MADIIIPPPGPDGYWHFTYVTTDSLDGRWYGGKRSTKKHPLSDRYLGSGNWVRKHPEKARLKREIVAFYPSSKEVFAAEAELITWAKVWRDPLCMNRINGGEGISTEAASALHNDPVFREAYETGITKRGNDLKWRSNVISAIRRTTSEPMWLERNAARLQELTSTPEWLEETAERNRHMASDPAYRVVFMAGIARRTDDPTWQENNAKALHYIHTDQACRESQIAGCRRNAKDPVWLEKMRATQLRLWADPEHRAKMDAAFVRRSANRANKKALAASTLKP